MASYNTAKEMKIVTADAEKVLIATISNARYNQIYQEQIVQIDKLVRFLCEILLYKNLTTIYPFCYHWEEIVLLKK